MLEIVTQLKTSTVLDAKRLIDEDPRIAEIQDDETYYVRTYPNEARTFFATLDSCNEAYYLSVINEHGKIVGYGICFRDLMQTELPKERDIRPGTTVFDELMLEGLTFAAMYIDPEEAIKLALRENPGLASLGPEEAKNNEALYNQLLLEGRKLLLRDLERGKAYLAEQKRKSEEHEKELAAQKKKLEKRAQELDKREKEIAQKEEYSLMLHSSKETDQISYLPGRKHTYDMSREEYHITSPGALATWIGAGKKGSIPPIMTFPPKASKLFSWLAIEITANRGQVAKNGGRSVIVMVDDWATKRGLRLETSSQKQEARKDLLEAIEFLQGERMFFPYTGGDRNLVSGKDPIKRGRGIVGYKVVLDPDVYETLKANGTCTYYPEALFRVDETLPGAYSIGYAMAMHYFMDSNIRAETNGTLTVGSLYDKSFLPSYDEVRKEGQNWRRIIQEPMNRALDHLLEIGLLGSLEYDKTFPGSFQEWETVRVEFTLKDAPDRRAKLEKKEQEEATAKKPKKAVRKKNSLKRPEQREP